MIFLSITRINRIYGCWHAELLVLTDDGCRRILWNHKSRVETWFRYQKGRQSTCSRDQLIDSSLRNTSQFCQRDSQEIHGQCQGLTVEISRRNNVVLDRKSTRLNSSHSS